LTQVNIDETTVSPRPHQRIPKTAKTTTSTTTPRPRKLATHAPWPDEYATSSTAKPRATHAPWPGDERYGYGSDPIDKSYSAIINNHNRISSHSKVRATHSPYPFRDQFSYLDQKEHLYPSRSTYAPYVYGSSNESKKKNLVLSILDREMINNWAKDFLAYFAAPFMVPSAISNAITNIPAGIEVDTLWGRITKNLRSALLKRSSEERGGSSSSSTENDNSILSAIIKKKLVPVTNQLADVIIKRIRDVSSAISSVNSESTDKDTDDEFKKKKKSIDGSSFDRNIYSSSDSGVKSKHKVYRYYSPNTSASDTSTVVKLLDLFRVKKQHRQDPHEDKEAKAVKEASSSESNSS